MKIMNKKSSEINVAVGILARDCADALRQNIPRVDEMCSSFKSYKIIVYENDSKDDTKELLTSWAKRNSNVKAIMEDGNTITIPDEIQYNPYPEKSKLRIERMVGFRNRLLDEMEKENPDVCIFVDIDLEWIDPKTVPVAIDNAPKDWGGLFGNGKVIRRYSKVFFERPQLYDSYAYVKEGVDPYSIGTWLLDKSFHEVNGGIMYYDIRKSPYVPCTSAFNNIGIYKWEAIKGLRYKVVQTKKLEPFNAALCEHVLFNMSVIKRGYRNYMAREIVVHSRYIDRGDYTKWYDKWKMSHEKLHFYSKHKKVIVKIITHKMLYALGMHPYRRIKL